MLCIFDSAARPIETKKSAALKFSAADSLNFGATNYSAADSPVSLSLLFLYVQQRSGHLRVCSSCKGDVSLEGGRDCPADFSALDSLVLFFFYFFIFFTEERVHTRMFELQSQQGGT